MHQVEIDEARIFATFDHYANQVEPDQLAGNLETGEPGEPGSSGWERMTPMIGWGIQNKLCPNWDIPPDTIEEFNDALAGCLDQLMPGGIGNLEKWGPWGKLLFATGSIALAGVDFETMTFKPLQADPGGNQVNQDPHQDPHQEHHQEHHQEQPGASDGPYIIGGADDGEQ